MKVNLVLVLLLLMNFRFSYFIAIQKNIDFKYKIYQNLFVWLLPFLGAFILYIFYKIDKEDTKPTNSQLGGGSHQVGSAPSSGSDY